MPQKKGERDRDSYSPVCNPDKCSTHYYNRGDSAPCEPFPEDMSPTSARHEAPNAFQTPPQGPPAYPHYSPHRDPRLFRAPVLGSPGPDAPTGQPPTNDFPNLYDLPQRNYVAGLEILRFDIRATGPRKAIEYKVRFPGSVKVRTLSEESLLKEEILVGALNDFWRSRPPLSKARARKYALYTCLSPSHLSYLDYEL